MSSLKGIFTTAALLSLCPLHACTTVIVGKNRTKDGSVLLAHTEDLGNNSVHQLMRVEQQRHKPGDEYALFSKGAVPQPACTYAYIGSKIFDKKHYPGDITTGVNEFQVSIANNMAWMREVPDKTAWEILPGGVIWTEFTQLALERAKTAREAVQIIGELCEKYTLSADPGAMFAVADPNEGWWVEMARHGQWIAQRVPDDGIAVRSGCYRIGAVNLDDSSTILHSPQLVSFAQKKGWYNPTKDGAFDFSKAYGNPLKKVDPAYTLRQKMADKFFSNRAKVDTAALIQLMRWCFEDTDAFQADPKTGSPFRTKNYTNSNMYSEMSAVVHLRKNIPKEIGGLMWLNFATPKTGVYIPFYFATQNFYQALTLGTNTYSHDSAYWRFRELAFLVDLSYNSSIKIVNDTWEPIESQALAAQAKIEAEAQKLIAHGNISAAQKNLTDYSNGLAAKVFHRIPDLTNQVKSLCYLEK